MKKYPKIKYPNDDKATGVFASGEVVVQEKLDGANFRFTHERNLDEEYHTPDSKRHIVFGSRNVQYKNVKDESKQFSKPIKHIRQNVDPVDIKILEDQYDSALTFFGEAMIPHTLSYDWESTPAFVGFDVYKESEERWLRQPEVRFVFGELGLSVAPVIAIVPAEDWDDYDVDTKIDSEFGDVKAEGLTFKNYDTQTFAKYVREDFKEKNKQTFGKSQKQQTSGAEKLSYQYITNSRIENKHTNLLTRVNGTH
ncbi:MAG: RNA ligase [Candidatus Nanosalina sp. J07AB43]|nr:MAG: RNA ligase [Candidatus Nanosalina sp. J07AB43]